MIIISSEDIDSQIALLFKNYPNLMITSKTSKKVIVAGKIQVNRFYKNFSLNKEYGIEISIHIDSFNLPSVRETEHYISKKYPHILLDGNLCLATESNIRYDFRNGFNIINWMQNYVEAYFFSYEYYQRYECFPFGERSHGSLGIKEFYRDLLKVSDTDKAYSLMIFIAEKPYRGHQACPCNSSLNIRNCHKDTILKCKNDTFLLELIKRDIDYIRKEEAYAKNNRASK